MSSDSVRNILVIRRDNIGDLVCTTPLLTGLRQRYPQAHLAVLVNSYNAPVLQGHPAIDELYIYEKAKHRAPGQSRWGCYRQTLATLWRMRRRRWQRVYLAGAGYSARAAAFVRWLRCDEVIGFAAEQGHSQHLTAAVDASQTAQQHHVESVYQLGQQDRLPQPIGPLTICANPELRQHMQARLPPAVRRLGVHISARKPSQRWPLAHWQGLLSKVRSQRPDWQILLFWSPGAEDDPRHPGDDGKAQAILTALASEQVVPMPTQQLDQLIAGLDLCDQVFCSDGGAMHVAAGLGKPLVCLFGETNPANWHPWGVPYQLLQAPSRQVADISVEQVWQALLQQADSVGRQEALA